LARAGFPALGTTSAGIAFSAGLPDDGSMGRDRMVERISDIAAAVERAARYSNAGADCVFVPGPSDAATIGRLAEAIEAPLNVVAGLVGEPLTLAELSRLGVRRVGVGGSLARAALGLVERAAQEMLNGRFDFTRRRGRARRGQPPDGGLTPWVL
jgi:2-methylisocitrate lyase-like PEP mutase family enzyme